MANVGNLYKFTGNEVYTSQQLREEYPWAYYYLTTQEEDFIRLGITIPTLSLMKIVQDEETDFGGAVYIDHRKFVAVGKADEEIQYREVKLTSV